MDVANEKKWGKKKDGLFGWIYSKKTIYKCKKSLEPVSVKVVPEIVPDPNTAQNLDGSNNSVGENKSGLVGWDNGAVANRESDIRLVDYDQMIGLE